LNFLKELDCLATTELDFRGVNVQTCLETLAVFVFGALFAFRAHHPTKVEVAVGFAGMIRHWTPTDTAFDQEPVVHM
jgi:hypothetical protein